jgi:stage II sporulation protein P
MKWMPNRRSRMKRGTGTAGLVKMFAVMAASTFVLMMVLGLGSYVQAKLLHVPALTMKGLTSGVPGELFMDMIALESNALPASEGELWFNGRNIANFLFRFLIDVNPLDPKSLLASELPGLSGSDPIVLRASASDPEGLPPLDFRPQPGKTPQPGSSAKDPNPSPATFPEISDWNFEQVLEVVDNRHIPAPASEQPPAPAESSAGTETRKVFIYHSHNRESFLPELPNVKSPNEAYDAKINVSLLGSRLAERLTELGLGAFSSDIDYQTAVKDHNWNRSYQYSLETVKEAMAAHPELEYYIDLHRDSQGKKITTSEFNGKSYARVAFIIGQKNPNWKQNDAFAAKIHNRLEEKYPGLSRGIWGKDGSNGHGEYNQSISPNSILIEVGGVENTLEECYRTIDVLAQVFAEVIMDAERVDNPANVPKEEV